MTSDIRGALKALTPVYESSQGVDGFVSVEVDPALARDTNRTTTDARSLHELINAPNLMVKIPGTSEGLPSIRTMIGEGRSINVTLIFSVSRYIEVMESYVAGLEDAVAAGHQLYVDHREGRCSTRSPRLSLHFQWLCIGGNPR